MSLLADNLSLISKNQARPVCSKIAISSVVVLLEKRNKQTNLKKSAHTLHMILVNLQTIQALN